MATGKVLFQWRSDHHVGFGASYERVPTKPGNSWDYFHVNSISIDPTDQNLIISSRNTWAVYKVDRNSGKVLWKLGGKDSNFKMGAGHALRLPAPRDAAPRWHPDDLRQRGRSAERGRASRAGWFCRSTRRPGGATIRSQYHHHPPVLSEALGSVQELDQGHTFIGWGTSSYFTEYDAGGQVLFDGRLTPGTSSYRAFKDTWNGTPAAAPTRRRRSAAARQVQLHVSWNGATGVSHWGIVGGSDAQQLTQIGTARVAGFETQITVPNAPSRARRRGARRIGQGARPIGVGARVARLRIKLA